MKHTIHRDILVGHGLQFDMKTFRERTIDDLSNLIQDIENEKEDLIRKLYDEKIKRIRTNAFHLGLGIWIGIALSIAFYYIGQMI